MNIPPVVENVGAYMDNSRGKIYPPLSRLMALICPTLIALAIVLLPSLLGAVNTALFGSSGL